MPNPRRAQMGDERRAIAYVRASTEDQKLSGEAQRDAIATWAALRGIEIVEVFEERISGAAPLDKRGQVLAAIAALRNAGAGLFLVAKRDRLARDVMSALTLESLAEYEGARIVSVAGEGSELEGPEGRLIRTILDAVAAYERALISIRTRAVKAVQRAKGIATGGLAPFGYRIEGPDRRLVEDEREQEIVRYLQDQRARGKTWKRIVELCRARGVEGRIKGRTISLGTIRNIIGRNQVIHRDSPPRPPRAA